MLPALSPPPSGAAGQRWVAHREQDALVLMSPLLSPSCRVAGHDETELGLCLPAQVQLVHDGEEQGHSGGCGAGPTFRWGAAGGHDKPV